MQRVCVICSRVIAVSDDRNVRLFLSLLLEQ